MFDLSPKQNKNDKAYPPFEGPFKPRNEADRLYHEGYLALQNKHLKEAKELLEQAMSLETDNEFQMVNRNILGQTLEKLADVDNAIKLYEENVSSHFTGDFPYDRLRVIYARQQKYNDVVRVLTAAVYVFENDVPQTRSDRIPKLTRFREQLDKAKIKAKAP